MEKKSLNKKLQLNKETIATIDKNEQNLILGGVGETLDCNVDTANCNAAVKSVPAAYSCLCSISCCDNV